MDNTRIPAFSRDMEHIIDLILFKGIPENNDPDREIVVLVNHGYVVGFSPERLQPAWAAYRVAGFKQDFSFDRPHLYYDDRRLEPEWRIGANTFGKHHGIQYHVGHMVPNEIINRQFGRLAQMETFLMSNMSPQRETLNTGVWLDLEDMIRNIEDTPARDHVWAIVGPIFPEDPEVIERPNGKQVPIPEAYFCITVDPFRYPWDRRSNVDVACFKIAQDTPKGTPLENCFVDLEEIEKLTNLSFFPGWKKKKALESLESFEGLESLAPETFESPPGSPETRHRLLRQLE